MQKCVYFMNYLELKSLKYIYNVNVKNKLL